MLSHPPAPLILSLGLDRHSFEVTNELRRRHFPANRLQVGAHLTLFHALPGENEASIRQTLEAVAAQTASMELEFSRPRFLGRGVAIEVECEPLSRLRNGLRNAWRAMLSPQDAQGFRAHITIQNKVSEFQARALFEQLEASWQPFRGRGEALLLWHYRGGPWEAAARFDFETNT